MPRSSNSVSPWWIHATSRKHKRSWHGKNGDARKPTSIITQPKINVHGPKVTVCSVPATLMVASRGRSRTPVAVKGRAIATPRNHPTNAWGHPDCISKDSTFHLPFVRHECEMKVSMAATFLESAHTFSARFPCLTASGDFQSCHSRSIWCRAMPLRMSWSTSKWFIFSIFSMPNELPAGTAGTCRELLPLDSAIRTVGVRSEKLWAVWRFCSSSFSEAGVQGGPARHLVLENCTGCTFCAWTTSGA